MWACFGTGRRELFRLCGAARREWIADAEANGERLEFLPAPTVSGDASGLPGPVGPTEAGSTEDA